MECEWLNELLLSLFEKVWKFKLKKLLDEILLFQSEDLNSRMFSTYNDIIPASSTTQLIGNKLKNTSLVFPTEANKMNNKQKQKQHQQQQRTRGRPFRIPLEPLKEGHLMDPMERMFLEAVERGDKQTVLRCLRGARAVNVNCTNMLGRSAIQVGRFRVFLPRFLGDLQSSTLEIPRIGKFPMTVWRFISRSKYCAHHLIPSYLQTCISNLPTHRCQRLNRNSFIVNLN